MGILITLMYIFFNASLVSLTKDKEKVWKKGA